MAEYYYNDSFNESNKRKPLVMSIVDGVALIVSTLSLVLLLLLIITPLINPAKMGILPAIGLLTPAIYLVAFLMALYWIIRWKWRYALVLIVPLVIAAPRMSLYLQLDTRKHYETKASRGEFKFVTFNVKHFVNLEGQNVGEQALEYIDSINPYIIAFQEYNSTRIKDEMIPSRYTKKQVGGQAIWSRGKITASSEELISADSVENKNGSGSAFWADILIGGDTVRLYNIHLHSTSITSQDNDYISEMNFLGDTVQGNQLVEMFGRFKDTSIYRAHQADSLAKEIATAPRSIIVCGDFNDTPNSYAYHKLSRRLNDAFVEQGAGYSHTYRGFMNMLRIDYVLTSDNIDILKYDVDYVSTLSDHYPVITTLKFK